MSERRDGEVEVVLPGAEDPWARAATSRWFVPGFLACVALLALGFYHGFVLHGARMLFGTDMLGQAYQLRKFAVEQVRAGHGIPLWNPFVYGGEPYLAILPGPLFYPTSVLYYLMPLWRAIGWTFVFHTFLAGAAGYFAARAFRLDRWPAVVGALAFMFTGYMVSLLYGGHDGRMFAMTLVPLAFGMLERGMDEESVGWFLVLGAVLGLQILTPHVQVMYYSSLMLALYAAYRLAEKARGAGQGGRLRALARPAGFVVLAFVVGAALGSVQLLPTVGMLGYGVRGAPGHGGYEFAASFAMPPQELTAFFLPDLIGSLSGHYWGSNPIKLHTEFLGAIPLALALIAVAGQRGEDRRIWFLTGASLLGVLFALGSATPVHKIAYYLVPMVKRFRAPAMMLAPVVFFVALLAGHGWQRVLRARRQGGGLPWTWIWLLSAPFLVLSLAAALAPHGLQQWVYHAWYPENWPRQPPPGQAAMLRENGLIALCLWGGTLLAGQAVAKDRLGEWVTPVLCLLLVAELWRVDARYLLTVDHDRVFQPDRVTRYLQAHLREGERIWPLQGSYGANEPMGYGIPTITGSQNFRLRWYDRLVGGLDMQNLLRAPAAWPLFDLRYLTTRSAVDAPLLQPADSADGVHAYAVRDTAPHAFFPARVEALTDSSRALSAVLGLRDATASAVVDAPEAPPAGAGRAELTEYLPDLIALKVHADRAGLLFLSEIYHPDWKATVDGAPVPVLRTDVAFRGVVVPQGDHVVTLRYRSRAFRVGAWLAGLTTALLAGAFLALGWRRRRRRAGEGEA